MPPILSGILSIYGLVVSVIISSQLHEKSALHTNFLYLAAGFTTGLCGLAAGFCIGIVGDAGVRGTAMQPRLYVGMMLMLIFAEVLGELFFPRFWTKWREGKRMIEMRGMKTNIFGCEYRNLWNCSWHFIG
jgi:F0F1-type ATP synthase membrane subunit c/vacuolar-type H+-ATPase subunit K